MLSDEEREAIEFFEKSFKKKIPPYWYDDTISNIEEKIKVILNLIEKQSKEIEELKASHIMTHNKSTNTEKAKIFDVIDNSLDRYIEKKFPVTITKEELEKRWKE